MNEHEVLNHFKNNTEKTCGQFNPYQLKTYKSTTAQSKKYTSLSIGLASFSLFSVLSTAETKAQNKDDVLLNKKENIIIDESNHSEDKEISHTTISGTVVSVGLPLPGVNVYIKHTNIGAVTDFDGVFKITGELKSGDILVFNSLGFKTNEYIIPENFSNDLILNLKEDFMLLENVCVLGEVNVKKVYSSRKNLWQRIKNWL